MTIEQETPFIFSYSFVAHFRKGEIRRCEGDRGAFLDRIEEFIREEAKRFGVDIECQRSSSYAFRCGIVKSNSDRCVICGTWVSAQNKPKIIRELALGAEHEGMFYCDKHLPDEAEAFERLFPYGREMERFPGAPAPGGTIDEPLSHDD